MVRFMKQVLTSLLLDEPEDVCEAVFLRIAPLTKLHMLQEGLKLFMQHFLLKKKGKDIRNDPILKDRIAMATRALSSAQSQMLLWINRENFTWQCNVYSLSCKKVPLDWRKGSLCCLRSITAHMDHFFQRLSLHLSGSHTFLVVLLSYVLQVAKAFLELLPFWLIRHASTLVWTSILVKQCIPPTGPKHILSPSCTIWGGDIKTYFVCPSVCLSQNLLPGSYLLSY